jgi:hypothetical protein
MRALPSSAKSPSAALIILILLGSSAAVLAEPAQEQPPAPAPSEPAPAEPAQPAPVNLPPAPAIQAGPTGGAIAEPPKPAAAAPPITEVGVERLPGSAYPEPQTRGLQYGSLWLTFHGLQWPYMPARGNGSHFVIGLSGWGWIDTAYEKFSPWGANPSIDQSRISYWKQQSRLLARVTPTYSFDDWFVQGQVELVGTGDQTISRSDVGGADTDDLWLRIGQWGKWDFQVGRYEGWEVFHLGMGLDQNTFERKGAVGLGESSYPIQFYGLTDNEFRPQGSAGNMAFHYYPLPVLRVELLGMAGSLSGPTVATRPVAILDLGWFKLKAGAEYQRVVGQQASDKTETTSRGLGAAAQLVFEPHLELGLNVAQGTIVSVDSTGKQDLKGSLTRTSIGGFANVSNGSVKHPLIFGVGGLFTRNVDQNDILQNGVVDNYWLFQGFVAAQYVAFSQFYIKLVGGYSRGHWLTAGNDPPITFDDEMYSVRLRFSFYF